jgi:peptide/nickel transport system ATP-binding protein
MNEAPNTQGPLIPERSTRALVQVKNLSKRFEISKPWLNRMMERQPRAWLRAVDGLSFEIPKGQTLALVGESGCGKSTLARLLVGLETPDHGEFHFDGQSVFRSHPKSRAPAMRRRMQMVFQDPYASLNPRWRVQEIVTEPRVEQARRAGTGDLRDLALKLLEAVGLSANDLDKYPHQYSGGQRQRISIARALASQPEFLVCDEPTSALDVSVQAQILALMQRLQRERGLTYLFISHNLAVAKTIADQVGVMYSGRLVELAPTMQLFAQPQHPYTRMLIDAVPRLSLVGTSSLAMPIDTSPTDHQSGGCAFHPRCPLANSRCRQESPVMLTTVGHQIACHAVQEGRQRSYAGQFRG